MKVLMVGAEAVPFAKVGGLGDVLGALPGALQDAGAEVTLLLPRYRSVDPGRYGLTRVPVPADWHVGLNHVDHGFGLLRGRLPDSDAQVLFLENDHFFDRYSVYNAEGGRAFADDAERWIFFQRGCMEVCKLLGLRPDIIHAHDAHAALIPAFTRTLYAGESNLRGAATVLTIHNLAHQGNYGREALALAGFGDELFYAGGPLEAYGDFNMMKAGIVFADRVTTVSPTYARQIRTEDWGHGLDGVLRARSGDLHGVLNGIDPSVWSPEHDTRIVRNYSAADREGKRACKRALLERLGLPAGDLGPPVLAFIGRLVPQKGCDLLEAVLPELLERDLRFVGLGSGADTYEEALRGAARAWPEKAAAVIGFDDDMAHWIEAGADILLMPSRYEPCGLNQMYSLAYGTVPVVHATGGLADTVIEVAAREQGGSGFRFHRYEAGDFKQATYRALTAYQDPARWERLVQNGMSLDNSWAHAAREYLDIYRQAAGQRRAGA